MSPVCRECSLIALDKYNVTHNSIGLITENKLGKFSIDLSYYEHQRAYLLNFQTTEYAALNLAEI